jgi:molybdate transport system substrate-binding protein
VAYIDPSAGGSSGIYLDQLFERLGMREQIRAKAVLVPGGLVAAKLMDGSADLALHQISEIKAVPGAVLVGPIPAEIQHTTVYSAARPAQAQAAGVEALLAYLKSPQMLSIWRDKGMEALPLVSR